MKKYNKLAMIICSFGLLFLLTGVTYSFFNYTRTGNPNNFRMGRISFESKNEETITISNLFPIDPADTDSLNDPNKVGAYQITITGDTDYDDGLEYLVSIVDSHITTSTNKTIPLSISIETTGLGNNEENYLSLRKTSTAPITKKLIGDYITGDNDILVGFIPTNNQKGTVSGVNGNITIKAYLDKNKIAVSDTIQEEVPTPAAGSNAPEYIYNTNATNEEITSCANHLINDLGFPGDIAFATSYCSNENTQIGRISDSFSTFPDQIKNVLIGDNIFIDPNATNSNTNSGNGTTSEWVNGRLVLTTTEWESLNTTGLSFKIKVEANKGIWYMKSLDAIMRKNAVVDNRASQYVSERIDFSQISGDTNGKGIYILSGTENDQNPIYYYRGDVKDNNVLFANKCWKIVRTTETGGTKLVYNGTPQPLMNYLEETDYNVSSVYNFTYNNETSSWEKTSSNNTSSISFSLTEAASDYVLDLESSIEPGETNYIYIFKNDTQIAVLDASAKYAVLHFDNFGSITPTDIITIVSEGSSSNSQYPSMDKFRMYHSSNTPLGVRCDNMGNDTRMVVNDSNSPVDQFKFNENKTCPAYNGFMYGTVYAYSTSGWVSGRKYGSGFTYNGSTYQLVDPVSSVDSTHHYSCNLSDGLGRCEELRYQYYSNGAYIVLTGGDGVEEALAKMQTNTNSSIAKQMLESWYETNLASYTNKLEDTIWCNDRSIPAESRNGWIPNGGELFTTLQYSPGARGGWGESVPSLVNKPTLACANKNDRFTVSNSEGNEALTYPIGLLTQDEYMLAGATRSTNINYYLYNGDNTWLLSPVNFYINSANNFYMFSDGSLGYNAANLEFSLRPSISLKKGFEITSGTGIGTDPFVIE